VYFILMIVHEGFVRHCSLWDDPGLAKQHAINLLAPHLDYKPGGNTEKDWSAIEDILENFGDDGDFELYLQMIPMRKPGETHVAVINHL
jgi:hypothetical protein